MVRQKISLSPTPAKLPDVRLLSIRGEPLFHANWDNVTFIHYETDPEELRRCVPYHLDLYDGCAFVSLVAFTMRGMRPRFGGRIGELLLKPIASHYFLNVRTYVTHNGEAGIYFMAEWLSNRIAAEPARRGGRLTRLAIACSRARRLTACVQRDHFQGSANV